MLLLHTSSYYNKVMLINIFNIEFIECVILLSIVIIFIDFVLPNELEH